jgi:hypothetical protein
MVQLLIGAMKDRVRAALKEAFQALVATDGSLFAATVEQIPNVNPAILASIESEYGPRKLHEVCLNHRLAVHIERALAPLLEEIGQRMFIDVEFTRNGLAAKVLTVRGQDKIVRPDIIIHNRRNGNRKMNFLVVECKKEPCSGELKGIDRDKIEAFLTDQRYEYYFGLQVLYGDRSVSGTLFWKEERGGVANVPV